MQLETSIYGKGNLNAFQTICNSVCIVHMYQKNLRKTAKKKDNKKKGRNTGRNGMGIPVSACMLLQTIVFLCLCFCSFSLTFSLAFSLGRLYTLLSIRYNDGRNNIVSCKLARNKL